MTPWMDLVPPVRRRFMAVHAEDRAALLPLSSWPLDYERFCVACQQIAIAQAVIEVGAIARQLTCSDTISKGVTVSVT